ncbi:MAG: hypothetical protein QM756_21180 [Polyangiaceae bacterium]
MANTLRVVAGMFLLPACSLLPGAHGGASTPVTSTPAPAIAPATPAAAAAEAAVEDATPPDPRRVGDVVVHRFSGSYRRSPLVLTEEVVAKEGNQWVVDLALEESGKASRLRVRMSREGVVSAVSRLERGKEVPAQIDDYGALVEKTLVAADVNEGLLGAERNTCVLGARELDCETKSYKVWLADRPATLKLTSSADLPGQDVGGGIRTQDGKLLYRSELVSFERKGGDGSVASADSGL